MNHYVYEITNLVNGKKYIGKRSCKCSIEDDKYMGSGKYLLNAISKYGKKNFIKNILKVCENEKMAFEWEKFYIEEVKAYNNLNYYNISSGGDGGRGNFITKTKSELDDIYRKISKAQKGKFKGGKNPNAKKIVCINTGKVFDTIKDASIEYEAAEATISRCCNGISASYGGKSGEYISFMYYDEYMLLSNDEINSKISKLKQETYKATKRKVVLLNTKDIFDTLGDASEFIGKSIGAVCMACNDRKRSAGKINGEPALWMYYDEYINVSELEIQKIFNNFNLSKEEKYKNLSNKVVCLNTGEVFDKIKDAEDKYGIKNIGACCRKIINAAGKINGEYLIWVYYDEYLDMTQEQIREKIKVSSRIRTGENNANSKKVILLNTFEVFECMKDAANKFNLSCGNLTKACSDIRFSCGKDPVTKEKLKWMYYNDYLKQQENSEI